MTKFQKASVRSFLIWLPIKLIRFYKLTLSPYMGRQCRFTPTCSTYAIEALEKYGLLKGSLLAVWRILRCNPFGGSGYDPVP
ncbi:MAG: membrane protein insertion efficiency factor YidD [Bacteroidales bacterium]|nr:membrane protein insertion efficiency factor YidD [Candidatus Cacconaster equi]